MCVCVCANVAGSCCPIGWIDALPHQRRCTHQAHLLLPCVLTPLCRALSPAPPWCCVAQDNKEEKDFGKACSEEVRGYEAEISKDYRLNFRLHKACEKDVDKLCPGLCQNSDGSVSSCSGGGVVCIVVVPRLRAHSRAFYAWGGALGGRWLLGMSSCRHEPQGRQA